MDKSFILLLGLPIISGIFFITFFCLWLRQRARRYILDWSLAFACGLIGASLGLARLFVVEAAWFSFLGNGFMVTMAFFAARGLLVRHTGKTWDHLMLPVLACTLLAGFWFGFVEPSIFARGTATSLGAATALAFAAALIFRAEDRDMVACLTAMVFAATAVILVGRPIVVFAAEGAIAREAAIAGSWWGVSFRFFAMLYFVSVAILFLHRIATDLLAELKVQASTDHLTGVLNRGGFFARVGDAMQKTTYAALICDIDEFKNVNDTYGHNVGDAVVRSLAGVISDAAHSHGYIVGRLGGDEFVTMLPGADLVEARAFAEKICMAFASAEQEGLAITDRVTISVGVAVALGGRPLDLALEHADSALYRAKLNGKNRVETVVLQFSEAHSKIRKSYRGTTPA